MGYIIPAPTREPEKLSTGRTRQWLANQELGATGTALLENYFEEGGFVPAHWHRTEELLVCLEGQGQVIIDQQQYDFPAGSVAVIPPMTVHEVRNSGKGRMRMLAFFPEAAPETIWINEENRQ